MFSTPHLEAATPHASLTDLGDAERMFRRPPASHGPVPFYWWAGEKLDRDRIAWQLDRLFEKGVRQTVVSYPHMRTAAAILEIRSCFRRSGGTCSGGIYQPVGSGE